MKIRAGYEISYDCPQPTPMILQLSVHPTRNHVRRRVLARRCAAQNYAQYANLNASGSNTGVPLTFKDEVWTVGFGVTYKFGAPATSAAVPTYPVKALPPK